VCALLAALAAACSSDSPGAPSGDGSQLRLVYTGPSSIQSLTVIFPSDQIGFGDVSPGTTTTYRNVPNGVFRYGAWRFVVDGAVVNQPVIDWVGEQAMEGSAFTYTIELAPAPTGGRWITLKGVTRDR
jgi:hypothetical protein